ncbi:MAG: hypothetical protein IKT61_02090 [Clostridia bacterium]|nr:hypothetical protein [Clostridia bacterium]
MAKAKTKKAETKEKKELTYEEYSKAVLLTGFVAAVRNELTRGEKVSAIRFVPILDGYHIFFNDDTKECKIAVEKRRFTKGYKVRKLENGFKKVTCSLKTKDDYEKVIAKLFGYKTEKSKKKKKK